MNYIFQINFSSAKKYIAFEPKCSVAAMQPGQKSLPETYPPSKWKGEKAQNCVFVTCASMCFAQILSSLPPSKLPS